MNDFLLAVWRNAYRERRYASINLVGLAIGFACCLLLALFLRNELTYDLHNVNHARVYRIAAEITTGGNSRQSAWIPRAAPPSSWKMNGSPSHALSTNGMNSGIE